MTTLPPPGSSGEFPGFHFPDQDTSSDEAESQLRDPSATTSMPTLDSLEGTTVHPSLHPRTRRNSDSGVSTYIPSAPPLPGNTTDESVSWNEEAAQKDKGTLSLPGSPRESTLPLRPSGIDENSFSKPEAESSVSGTPPNEHGKETSIFTHSRTLTALSLPPVRRFSYLLTQSTGLIQAQGPYTVNGSRHLRRLSTPSDSLTVGRLVRSLTAAQDCLSTPQPEGPVFDDLKTFHMLWETTIEVIEKMLTSNELDLETFGWGMFGLAAGYLNPDELFLLHKARLHTALKGLPSLYKQKEKGVEPMVQTPAGKIHTLATANRTIHVCAIMILQKMRKDWSRVRWFHGISLCERWVAHLGWDKRDERRSDAAGGMPHVEPQTEATPTKGKGKLKRPAMHKRTRSLD